MCKSYSDSDCRLCSEQESKQKVFWSFQIFNEEMIEIYFNKSENLERLRVVLVG